MPVDTDSTQAVACSDVDGDGDSDLVFGNDGQNRLYLNLLRQLGRTFPAARWPHVHTRRLRPLRARRRR